MGPLIGRPSPEIIYIILWAGIAYYSLAGLGQRGTLGRTDSERFLNEFVDEAELLGRSLVSRNRRLRRAPRSSFSR